MSKKVLSRVAAAILTTSIVATGAVLGSSGPANAETNHFHKPPVTAPVDPGTDGGTGDAGGLITQKYDTGWG